MFFLNNHFTRTILQQLKRIVSFIQFNNELQLDYNSSFYKNHSRLSQEMPQLGVLSFSALQQSPDKVGSNGLPVTPSITKIFGRFQNLKDIKHENLCEYVDIIRGSHDHLYVIMEHTESSLLDKFYEFKNKGVKDLLVLCRYAVQILRGLAYIHERGIIHHNLSLKNILIDSQGKIKLTNYGLYYMTDNGIDVSFPIGLPQYLAPEIIVTNSDSMNGTTKSDIWSLGVILLELYLGEKLWSNSTEVFKIFNQTLSFNSKSDSTIQIRNGIRIWGSSENGHEINQEIPKKIDFESMNENLRNFLSLCLESDPTLRPSANQLLAHPFLKMFSNSGQKGWYKKPYLRSLEHPPQSHSDILEGKKLSHIFYYWRLAGGDVVQVSMKGDENETEFENENQPEKNDLKKGNDIQSSLGYIPSILRLPLTSTLSKSSTVSSKEQNGLYDDKIKMIPLDQLRQRISAQAPPALQSLSSVLSNFFRDENEPIGVNFLTEEFQEIDVISDELAKQNPMLEYRNIPLLIREKDIDYQFYRVELFQSLLSQYPFSRNEIIQEAKIDIPPLLRGQVWAAILGIKGDFLAEYELIDRETETPTDRQIDVDIPRCHQYHIYLSSPDGHAGLRNVLKSWVAVNKDLVYWQGLDSVCAPFVALNFTNHALAFACVQSFVPKFLNDFFLFDNSPILQEYLAVFAHILSFHDPELASHFHDIDFIPELYAIPWFLTLYSHVFPLDKIYHLWDRLLVRPHALPTYVGIAILKQLRGTLLASSFNECILLFSDLPEIDIEDCVNDAMRMVRLTPPSVSFREHGPQNSESNEPTQQSENIGWWQFPLPLKQKKAELAPRISFEDLAKIRDFSIVIDIRNEEDFLHGHFPKSLNVHIEELNDFRNLLLEDKRKYFIVLAPKGKSGPSFARKLVKMFFPRVALLNGGIDVLRTEDAGKICPLCTCKCNQIEAGQSKVFNCSLLNKHQKMKNERKLSSQ